MNQLIDNLVDRQFHLLYRARDLHYKLDRSQKNSRLQLFPDKSRSNLEQEFLKTVHELVKIGMNLEDVSQELNLLTLN